MEVIAKTAGEKTFLAKDRVTVKKVTFAPCGNGLGRAELSAEDAEVFLKAGATSGAYWTPKYELPAIPAAPKIETPVVEVNPGGTTQPGEGDQNPPPGDDQNPPGDGNPPSDSAIVEGYKQIPAGAKVTMLENLLATAETTPADIAAILELEKAREDGGRKPWLTRLEKAQAL